MRVLLAVGIMLVSAVAGYSEFEQRRLERASSISWSEYKAMQEEGYNRPKVAKAGTITK